jgi:cell division protein FtsB
VGLVLAFMAFYAVEGGEYGTTDLLALKGQVRRARGDLARLRHEVDSLQRLERALKQDPVLQEKVARELYGMLRPGELLYQVVPRDSAAARP